MHRIHHSRLFFRSVDGLNSRLHRFANSDNTIRLSSYTLANMFIAHQTKKYRTSLNVHNLFDTDYIPWGDIFYPNQLAIGSPRTLEFSFHMKF
nr:TonB-dependent receptor [Sulfidibacter corallicola]